MLRSMQPLIRSSSISTAPSRPRYCGNWPQTPIRGIAYDWVPAFRWQFWQARLLPAKRFAASETSGPISFGVSVKSVPVFDKVSERIFTNLADIGRRPLCQINRDRFCGRHLIASYPYIGAQSSNHEPNTLHRAGSPRCRSASSSSYHQSRCSLLDDPEISGGSDHGTTCAFTSRLALPHIGRQEPPPHRRKRATPRSRGGRI